MTAKAADLSDLSRILYQVYDKKSFLASMQTRSPFDWELVEEVQVSPNCKLQLRKWWGEYEVELICKNEDDEYRSDTTGDLDFFQAQLVFASALKQLQEQVAAGKELKWTR